MTQVNQAIRDYLSDIEQAIKAGNATEHTHRPTLKTLLEAIAGDDIRATNEPKQIACGAPDFIITRGVVPLGYVEAKDVGIGLDKTERSEQLQRYRESLGNLVLTDYLEFRWYLDGDLKLSASLPRPGKDGRIRGNDTAASEVAQLLGQFIAADLPLKSTPADLAKRMAGLARLIRGLIEQTIKAEGDHGDLHAQLDAFRKVLIESLSIEQFSDMYAQTLCYGLFAARCAAPSGGFTRQSAASQLPKTNPFLRKLFNTIAGPDLDERIAWAVDQLAELLARADMAAILSDFGQRTRQEDPVVHFYETFLAAYDPKMREARGVYYTPEPVVGYIVRSIDAILRRDFGIKDGLADHSKLRWKSIKVDVAHGKTKSTTKITEHQPWVHRVQILDPATGTGTFLYAVIQKIREHFDGNAGAWPGYVAEHLLPRLFGFELLMAPYAVAHMKLGLELEQTGYDFASDQRLGVYLTNTLEEAHELTRLPGFANWLSEEANAASEVKTQAPVMVVLGNPPYSGVSENKGSWIQELVEEYKREADGTPLQERRHWLGDDYVKFIRFAQWRITQTGHGVLGFVTNHGYLDNPTFRGMRQSLLRDFDKIYLLDLHGNSKKKEKTPDGGKDENVFDIQQGVVIGLFVRDAGERGVGKLASVFHADLYGLRAEKYAVLDAEEISTTKWQELFPAAPNYYFASEDELSREEYELGWKITEIMPKNALGFQTSRDDLVIDFDEAGLSEKLNFFFDSVNSDQDVRQRFFPKKEVKAYLPGDTRQWSLSEARKSARNEWQASIMDCSYRPFDTRSVCYHTELIDWPRVDFLSNVRKDNLWIGSGRQGQVTGDSEWTLAWAGKHLSDVNAFRRGGMTIFPLWVYPNNQSTDPNDPSIDLLEADSQEKTVNLTPNFVRALAMPLGHTPTPENTFAYVYAILYAPSYRTRYADFLKRDFPRVPLTANRALFDQLVAIGTELIALHVMDRTLPRITGFDIPGSNEVVKVRYAQAESGLGRVYINGAQYFDRVPQAVWDTHIGGYRVAEKWLKDRKGRLLSYDDLTHYQNVIAALARTLELQGQLDTAIAAAGGWPLS